MSILSHAMIRLRRLWEKTYLYNRFLDNARYSYPPSQHSRYTQPLLEQLEPRVMLSASMGFQWFEVDGARTSSTSGVFTVEPGQDFWVKADFENRDTDKAGGITMSFPGFDGDYNSGSWISYHGDTQGYRTASIYPVGHSLHTRSGATITSSDLMIEGFDGHWESWGSEGKFYDEDNILGILLTAPETEGSFEVYVRGCLIDDLAEDRTEYDNANWTLYEEVPSSSSYADQQYYTVFRYVINVVASTPDAEVTSCSWANTGTVYAGNILTLQAQTAGYSNGDKIYATVYQNVSGTNNPTPEGAESIEMVVNNNVATGTWQTDSDTPIDQYFFTVGGKDSNNIQLHAPEVVSCAWGSESNIALASNGAVATADSYGSYMGYVGTADKAIDGDDSTCWDGRKGTSGWLKVELPQAQTVDAIEIYWGSHKHTFNVQYSLDGVSWNTAISTTQSTNIEGSCGQDSYTFNPIYAKYFKINILTTSAPSSHIFQASIGEFKAYSTNLSVEELYIGNHINVLANVAGYSNGTQITAEIWRKDAIFDNNVDAVTLTVLNGIATGTWTPGAEFAGDDYYIKAGGQESDTIDVKLPEVTSCSWANTGDVYTGNILTLQAQTAGYANGTKIYATVYQDVLGTNNPIPEGGESIEMVVNNNIATGTWQTYSDTPVDQYFFKIGDDVKSNNIQLNAPEVVSCAWGIDAFAYEADIPMSAQVLGYANGTELTARIYRNDDVLAWGVQLTVNDGVASGTWTINENYFGKNYYFQIDTQSDKKSSTIAIPDCPENLVVSTASDELDSNTSFGHLSLREAIGLASIRSGYDTITFDSSLSCQTIVLNGTPLEILGNDLSIVGLGAQNLTIDANDESNIFNIGWKQDEYIFANCEVTIKNLKLCGGGYIGWSSTISICSSTAIIDNCVIQDNGLNGAAIATIDSYNSHLKISNSLFYNNAGEFTILGEAGITEIDGSEFSGNDVSSGVILIIGGESKIVNSLIYNNCFSLTTEEYSALITLEQTNMTINNTTISGNSNSNIIKVNESISLLVSLLSKINL